MEIRNVRGYALEIAATGQLVPPGETVDVDADLGKRLLEQPDNWEPAIPVVAERPADSAAKAKWVAYAVGQGRDVDEARGLTRDELAAQYPPVTIEERPNDAEPGVAIGGFEPPSGDEIDLEPDGSHDDPAGDGETKEL